MSTTEELNKGFNLGDWEVLPAQGLLRNGGELIHPEPKVLKVLLALAKRDGNLVSKDELIEEVWEGKAFSDEPVLRCISLLRGHFHDKKPFQYVETLQRRGYRLLKPVELHVTADETAADKGSSLRLWKTVAAVVTIGFIAVAALNWISFSPPAVRSLAVLPFENLSGDPANEYLADGIKNSLAQRLSELQEFTIKNVRRSYEGEPAEVAAALQVESLLYGSVQLQNGTVRVQYEIVRGDDGSTLLPGGESGEMDELFALQERLATTLRDKLAGSATPQLITRREPDSVAYNSYMRGMYALELRFAGNNLDIAIERFRESIRLDESYGPAYLALATAYALLPPYQAAPLQEFHDLAQETIEAGVKMDSSIEDAAGGVYGFVHQQQKEWLKSEAAYRRAIGASVVDSNAFQWYSRMLSSVGRLEDARDVVLDAEVLDPDNAVIHSRIAMVYTWLSNSRQAREYFTRANELGATGNLHLLAESLFHIREGELEKAMSLTSAATGMAQATTDWIEPVYQAFGDPSRADAALAAIDLAWEQRRILPDIVLIVRTLLGDVDGAMEIARLGERPGEAFSMEVLFLPELAPLREHPDFVPLLERLGIVDYWSEVGCDWDGERVHCERN